ncbi:MAG: hypothetical protein JWP14_2662 [Frankiales bacterium]|nr:hypothetical protein [Frankiales bacterium]
MPDVPDPSYLPNADTATLKEFSRVRMMWSALVLVLLGCYAFLASVGVVTYGTDQAFQCQPVAETFYGDDPTAQTTAAINATDGVVNSNSGAFAKQECRGKAVDQTVALVLVAAYPGYVFVRTSRRI